MNKLLGATALAIVLGAAAAVAQTTAPTSPPAEKNVAPGRVYDNRYEGRPCTY